MGVNWFGKGAYVRRLSFGYENMNLGGKDQNAKAAIAVCSVWKWGIMRQGIHVASQICGEQSTLVAGPLAHIHVYQAYQCPDDSGPRLSPDFIDGSDESQRPMSERRVMYNERLMNAASVRRHCRRNARCCLHRVIPRSAWTIDPTMFNNVDIWVTVQASQTGNSKFHVLRKSLIQIRYLPSQCGSDALLQRIRMHAQLVSANAKSGSARSSCGDRGSMHPIGKRVMQNLTEGKYTSSSSDAESIKALGCAVQASAMLAASSVPAVLRVVQDFEHDSGLDPTPEMSADGGPYRVSTTMDLSVNLSNASHYDVNDATQGFSIWTEDTPGSTKNWFFVLPNVYGMRPGTKESYNGLVIRLSHGVLISWDGRIIRHCTSLMERKTPARNKSHNVYGTFFAAKMKNITLGIQKCEQRLATAWHQRVAGIVQTVHEEDGIEDIVRCTKLAGSAVLQNETCVVGSAKEYSDVHLDLSVNGSTIFC